MGDIIEHIEYSCFVFLTVLIVFGTTGNVVSLLIWSRGNNSKSLACSTYFKFLSVSDICVLLLPGIYEVVRLYPVRYWITEHGNFLCKGVTFGRLFTTQISTWLVVVITIERMASIVFPLKYHLDKARHRANIVCIIISVLAFSSNSIFVYGMEIRFTQNCQLNSPYIGIVRNRTTLSVQSAARLNALNDTIPISFNVTEGHNIAGNVSETKVTGVDQLSETISEFFVGSPLDKDSTVGFKNFTVMDQHKGFVTYFLNRTSSNLTNAPGCINKGVCDFVNLSGEVESTAWIVNYVVLICFMPLLIIILGNIAILFRLCTTVKQWDSGTRRNSLSAFTRLVLAIGAVFTLSTIPMALYVLEYFKIVRVTFGAGGINFYPPIARSLFCLNNGTNFILYFISGENFRQDFKHLLKSVFKRC